MENFPQQQQQSPTNNAARKIFSKPENCSKLEKTTKKQTQKRKRLCKERCVHVIRFLKWGRKMSTTSMAENTEALQTFSNIFLGFPQRLFSINSFNKIVIAIEKKGKSRLF